MTQPMESINSKLRQLVSESILTPESMLKVSQSAQEGIFAPWMMYKEDYLILGGHDPILKSAREDSDIFNRKCEFQKQFECLSR